MFDSGAGIRVAEAHGVLSVMTLLPPDFNETFAYYRGAYYPGNEYDEEGRRSTVQEEFINRVAQPSTLQYVGGAVSRITCINELNHYS
ncbi:unnamed protein product [Strongylus vulgaris]|uniref:Uncharacterized protein n=1 Tax=Strongylus vulgaris TaxID=40348 RepID=A0A3P7JR32_STRVU|nr:unnamed protein product [Strongylus vulgaris]